MAYSFRDVLERSRLQAAREATKGPATLKKPDIELTYPCSLRGESTGERRPCESGCAKGKQVPLQTCSLHGSCSVSLPLEGVKCCRTCPDRKDPSPPTPPTVVKLKEPPLNLSVLPPNRKSVLVPPLPELNLSPNYKRALVTVVFGEEGKKLFEVTGPYMRAYAREHAADLVVLDWPGHPAWPISSKFAIPKVLDFYDRIAYVDADVLLRPGCLSLFDSCAPDEFGFVDEMLHHRNQPHYKREINYHTFRRITGYPERPNLPWMFNAGVMVVPKEYKHLLLPPQRPLRVAHCSEQDNTNAQVYEAYLRGECKVRLMDRRCNWQNWTDYGFKSAPKDAILHWSGGGEERGSRNESIKAFAKDYPLPFHPSNYPVEDWDKAWNTDLRHVKWIHDCLMTGLFKSVLEIGCLHGYSTTAFLAALEADKVEEVHLCEPYPKPGFLELIKGRKGITFHVEKSTELLTKPNAYDFVFVDGDHTAKYMEEETKLILSRGVPVVFAHDTSSFPEYPDCDGPPLLMTALKEAGYHVFEDNKERRGEKTHRGMMLACRSQKVFEALVPLLEV